MKNHLFFLCMISFLHGSTLYSQFTLQMGLGYYQGKQQKTNIYLGTQSTWERSWDGRLGLYLGVSYRKQLGAFAIQPELNYAKKGGEAKGGSSICGINTCYNSDMDLDLRYLELPVYVLHTGHKKNGFYWGAGPALNYLMDGKYDGHEMQPDNDKCIARMHLAINLLVGTQSKRRFGINAYLSQSITNSSASYTYRFADIPDYHPSVSNEYYFTNFGVRISYRLGKLAK